MRVVLQRVSEASVSIEGEKKAEIKRGLLILLGIEKGDAEELVESMITKIASMRVFSDEEKKMNLSLQDIQGEILIVSQFTLFADTKKGNRPSFLRSEGFEKGQLLYETFIRKSKDLLGVDRVKSGVFGADMQIALVNDGPVTILYDTNQIL